MALLRPLALTTALLLAAAPAVAQETVDIGVLKDSDISVVQNILYPKSKRTEIGVHLGWLPFDPLVTTPKLELSVDLHLDEHLGVSIIAGGGYGLKTARYTELEGPAYGVSVNAYRYLAGLLAGVEWSPIYAKMSFGGRKVVHYDVFGTAHLGGTLEQSVIPGGGITVAPTLALGIGARFYIKDGLAIRFAVRDDLMVEYRALTSSWHFKQNGGVTLGISFMGKKAGTR